LPVVVVDKDVRLNCERC